MKSMLIKNHKYQLKYDYFVNEDGSIFSSKTNKILSTHLDKDGYVKVRLVTEDGRHTFSVHRLVLENFNPVENMEELQVNHINGNKQDNSLSNLEWTTASENNLHAHRIGLKNQKGSKNNGSKLNEEQVKEIIEMLLSKQYTQKQIGVKFGVSEDCIYQIKAGNNWKELTRGINFN